jgi:signal transduction histidine kinase
MAGWWRRRSLRSRLTLLAVGGLAAGLAVGGAVLVAALGATLQRSVDGEATRTGQDLARLVAGGVLPEPVPVTGEQQVQVVDADNRVLAASVNADRLVPILPDAELAEVRRGGKRYVDGDRIGVRGPVRVVAVPAGDRAGGATVLVAKPVADLRHSVQLLRTTLLVAFPLLVAALAAATWRVVGATLAPVEALRAGAAEISDSVAGTPAGRPARLPVPASHDEIHRLAVTLNDMLGRLERARARQRGFVADAAHELRSPLANLRTQLEVGQRLAGRTDWPALAGDLLADTRRLAGLVDDLLLLARGDGPGRPGGALAPVELGELLVAVAERSHGVAVAASGEPHWARGEPDALRRVVANLVDNAVRHTRTGVRLAVARDGAYHLLTVTDDGPGVPAADRERVFERFTRLDDARARDAGGAGLGLAIVRELVHRHGGTVRLVDAGPGVRVEVRLPAATPPGPDDLL